VSGIASKLRAYAELGRVSNLPTTLSNLLVGVAIAIPYHHEMVTSRWLWGRIAVAWLAVACFYIAGMAMNDLADAKIDANERPGRPIPAKRISRAAAGRFIVVLVLAGLAMLSVCGVPALIAGVILISLIVMYNSTHSLSAASVILLGASRAMVYAIGALAVSDDLNMDRMPVFAGAMAVYVAGFSIIARRETQPHIGRVRWVAELAVFAAVLPPFLISPGLMDWRFVLLPFILAAAWLSRGVGMIFIKPPATKQAVMIWLSGICLVDGLYLVMLNHWQFWFVACVCFIITTLAQKRLSGT
jgi:hypothetical protein